MKMCVTFGPKSLDVLIFQEIKVLLWVFKKILGPMHRIRYIVPNAEVFSVMKTLPFKKKTVRQRLPRFKPAQYQVLPYTALYGTQCCRPLGICRVHS